MRMGVRQDVGEPSTDRLAAFTESMVVISACVLPAVRSHLSPRQDQRAQPVGVGGN
jgi:hypothetical protein